jgi:UDP-glucose 4-epimerase
VRCDHVADAIKGVDIVFHEAARVSIRSSVNEYYDDAQTNLMGTVNVLRHCEVGGVKKIVFASSMAVYADCERPAAVSEDHTLEPIAPYGISKLASEKYCIQLSRQMGFDCCVLRYFNTYGPGQTLTPYVGVITIFINSLLAGKAPVIFGDGQQRRDFVHVSDIVAANLLAMKSDVACGIFNVGTGIGTSLNEIGDLLCRRINPDIECRHGKEQAGELRYSIADITRASIDLGYQPRVRLADRIEDVIEFYRQSSVTGDQG